MIKFKHKYYREKTEEELLKLFENKKNLDNTQKKYLYIELSNRGLLLNKLILISENRVRLAIAKNGYKLNILKYNQNPRIRLEVAKHGAFLDELIKDDYWEVRAEVARQGYGLDILAYDNDARVRAEVAKQGVALDTLANDESVLVKIAVASKGFELNRFVKDYDHRVRAEVARHGYGLEILIYDRNINVVKEVFKHNKYLDILKESDIKAVRLLLARNDLFLENFKNDISSDVRAVVAERLPIENIKDMINDKSSKVRAKLIKRGVLPYDENGNIIFGKTFNEQRELIKLGYIPETTELHLSNSKKEKIAWKIFAKNFGENLITTCSKELDYLNLSEFNKKRLFDKFQDFIKKEKIKERAQLNMIKNRKMILHRETERNL